MVLTINVNAAVDEVLFVDSFNPGKTMRTDRAFYCVGGKGLDSAVVLSCIGAPVQAITFLAGTNGARLKALLDGYGIATDYIGVPGETRTAHIIVEECNHRHSHITTEGYTLAAADIDRLIERIVFHADRSRWAVIAGSIPSGAPIDLYRTLVLTLKGRGIPVLVDCDGELMRHAISAKPAIVKMNQTEYCDTFGIDRANLDFKDMPRWCEEIRRAHVQSGCDALVITCGVRGILAAAGETVIHAVAPAVREVNAAGAGDAVSAALAYRLSSGDSWSAAMRFAAAVSAAVVLTEKTAECRMADVARLLPDIRVTV